MHGAREHYIQRREALLEMVRLLWRRSVVGEGLGGSFGRCLEEFLGIVRIKDMMAKDFYITYSAARQVA